jgi:hypothetical protein
MSVPSTALPVMPAPPFLMGKSGMRKYGPQDMRLRTTKDTDGPDWHLTEYAATALPGRAWYFSDPDFSRSGSGGTRDRRVWTGGHVR